MIQREIWDYIELWTKRNDRLLDHFHSEWQPTLEYLIKKGEQLEYEKCYYESFNQIWVQSLFVGTIMSLTPSGKFYAPFANSNVKIKEAALDELWYEFIEKGLKDYPFCLTLSEYDGCDLLIQRSYDENPEEDREYED